MAPTPADLQKCLRSRSHFLRQLRRPRRKCDLADELDESRSTIDRALRELEEAKFVTRGDSGYRTTLAGELALAEYDRYADRLDGIAELHDALADLPTDEPLDGALFEDAHVSLPSQRSPYEPVEALRAVVTDADHACVVGAAIIPQYVEMYREQIVDEGMTADFVLSEGVLEWLLSRQAEAVTSMVETGDVTLAETSTDWSFSLVVTEHESVSTTDVRYAQSDRSVGVMLYDEGTFLGFVHNDTREAVAWGEALFDRALEQANELGVSVASDGGEESDARNEPDRRNE
jgi:predicted transcriptional regulator